MVAFPTTLLSQSTQPIDAQAEAIVERLAERIISDREEAIAAMAVEVEEG